VKVAWVKYFMAVSFTLKDKKREQQKKAMYNPSIQHSTTFVRLHYTMAQRSIK